MRMTSGSAGSTSTTLLTSDSSSSTRPPAYPPTTPIRIDSAVASRPTVSPMISEPRVATSSWDSTSWPAWVVPSGCRPDGDSIRSSLIRSACRASIGPTTAISAKNPTIAAPARSFHDRRLTGTALSSGLPGAGVDDRVQHVDAEVRAEHGEGDDQEDRLHQCVVLVLHRLQQREADAGVGEHRLRHDRPAHHEPERGREPGDARQDRVAGRVGDHDPAP